MKQLFRSCIEKFIALIVISVAMNLAGYSQNYSPNTFSDPVITSINNATAEINGGSTISLRSALMASDNLGGAHTITLGTGIYLLDGNGTYTVPSQGTFSSRTIFMGNSSQNITINGNGPANTIINMDVSGRDRIMAINYDGSTADVITTISGVTFQNGYLNYDAYGGAAIYAGPAGGNTETLTITNCVFDNNICPGAAGSGGLGGAIYMFQGNLDVSNSSFTNNQSVDGDGGAIIYLLFNQGDNGTLNIANSTFLGNQAGTNGGAISFLAQGSPQPGQTFTASVLKNNFINNSASGFGGAIAANNAADLSVPAINFNRFSGNISIASAATSGLVNIISDGSVNAENNWWGCNTGPVLAGACDKAGSTGGPGAGSLVAGKWLQLKTTASPESICNIPATLGNTSLVTTGFLSNSADESINPADLTALIGLTVNWGPTTLGSLSGEQLSVQASGTATATFTSNGNGGTATVNAQVDNVPAAESSPSRATITVNSSSTQPNGATGITSICEGGSTTLTVSGGSKGTGAVTEWFTGSCGETLVFTGDALTVSPASTTTYFVRYNGPCNTTVCASVTVTVNTLSTQPTGVNGITTICNGGSTELTVTGGTKGTGAVTEWFTGSCGGTPAGTGDAITVSPTINTTYYVRYSGICNSTACATVTVTVNQLPVIDAPTVIQPTCALPTGTITVNATGSGILEYALNGGSFQTSNVFSGLAPGNYTISVRSQSAPDCVAYGSDPVVLIAASGCCVTPTITCPGNQIAYASATSCSAVVNYSAMATGTPSPVITYSFTGATTDNGNGTGSGSAFSTGVTTVTLTAMNNCGTATCSFNITVIDTVKPVITVSNISRCFADDNFGCSINLGATASDNCQVVSFTSDAPGCFPVGTTTVTWTATDNHGNSSTKTQTVTRNPEINITVCAGPTRTIYSGTTSGVGPFGPQTVNLGSTVTGGTPGYSYQWSPAAGLSNPNIANPVASPIATTTYTLTVTDSKGCTRSVSIVINVLPLSAAVCSGNGNNVKFSVCHIPPGNPANPQNICISSNALSAHLSGGGNGHNNCYLGPCQQNCFSTVPGNQSLVNIEDPVRESPVVNLPFETKEEAFRVNVFPNPASGEFNIQVSGGNNEAITVRILDATGVEKSLNTGISKINALKVGRTLTAGTYLAEVKQGDRKTVVKLIKL